MSDTSESTTSAGTRFPFINLEKAIVRAKELYDADQRGREMAVTGAFSVWKYSEKSSGGFQTIAALKMYGLLRDSHTGDTRKLALTDAALRYFRDEREDEKKKLLQQFALTPKLIASLWNDWHNSPPADTIARSHLKAERGLNEQGARSLLAIYKENLAFADLKGDTKPPEEEEPMPPGGFVKPPAGREINVMHGERVVFTEEGQPSQYLKLIASGDVDDFLLEALEDFVKRQRRRLKSSGSTTSPDDEESN
jgi:hypothetical protein